MVLLVVGVSGVLVASEGELSPNKWVTITERSIFEPVYYKVTVKKDGYLTFSAKKIKGGEYAKQDDEDNK